MSKKLSVAVMTKNNERTIGYVLESVKKIAYEIIVVDCGSTDNTIKIAEQYAAKIFFHEFKNFSEQRNYAISKCTGDYILMLDSDEIVSKGFEKIFSYLDYGYQSISFARYHLISLEKLEFVITKLHWRDWQNRVFCNNGIARYGNDKVHEYLKSYRPRLHCACLQVFHLDYLTNDYNVRKKKVEFYNKLEQGKGFPEFYLFEDYKYKTAFAVDEIEEALLAAMRKDKVFNRLRYESKRDCITQLCYASRLFLYKLLTKLRVFLKSKGRS